MRQQVVERDLAVDGGPDYRAAVGALKVPPHDLVEAAVAQHQGLELEAARAQQVDGLLVLVRETEGVVVPPAIKQILVDRYCLYHGSAE